MKIKPRHFPHPVLSFFSNDYKESTFDAEVEPKFSENTFQFLVNFNLNDAGLRQLIAHERAKFMVHIECSKTWVRYAEKTSNYSIEISIPSDKLHDRVDICIFIVANEEILNYSNDMFHSDFEGETFRVKKGDILAIGPEIPVELEKQPLASSIFQLVRESSFSKGDMSVNVENEKITVSLDVETHSKYQQLKRNTNLIPIFHSMIAVPALIYAISYIKESLECQRDMEEITSYSWYKSIRNRFEEMNIDIENPGSLEDPVNLAAKLINRPIANAMNAIEIFNYE